MLGLGVESIGFSFSGIEFVQLSSPRVRMPGIAVDLLNLNRAAQIDEQPSALGPGVEEKILLRLIFLGRKFAIMKFLQIASVFIPLTVNHRKLCFGSRIGFGRRWDVLKFESVRGAFVFVVINDHLDLAERAKPKKERRGSDQNQTVRLHKFKRAKLELCVPTAGPGLDHRQR